MRHLGKLLAPALLAAAAVLTLAGDARALAPGKAAPDFAGSWRNHPDASLSSLRGRWVLLEFWRTW